MRTSNFADYVSHTSSFFYPALSQPVHSWKYVSCIQVPFSRAHQLASWHKRPSFSHIQRKWKWTFIVSFSHSESAVEGFFYPFFLKTFPVWQSGKQLEVGVSHVNPPVISRTITNFPIVYISHILLLHLCCVLIKNEDMASSLNSLLALLL